MRFTKKQLAGTQVAQACEAVRAAARSKLRDDKKLLKRLTALTGLPKSTIRVALKGSTQREDVMAAVELALALIDGEE